MLDNQMRKILLIFGTRPEAIKMASVIVELKQRKCFDVQVCYTGQHKELGEKVIEDFKIEIDHHLDVMKPQQALSALISRLLVELDQIITKVHPDLVMVQGDTSSAYCGALCAFFHKIPVCHIEAGLRSHNIYSPFPEELYRRIITLISSYHFAPTNSARTNLLSEGVQDKCVFVTGNTGIDALAHHINKEENEYNKGKRIILLTMHRRENIGVNMHNVLTAMKRILKEFTDVEIVIPVHPNPSVKRQVVDEVSLCNRINVLESLAPSKFYRLMNKAYLIVTDSGGIQEEATYLGKPTLVVRNETERNEGVLMGCLRIVGTDDNDVYTSCKELLEDNSLYNSLRKPSYIYGDGTASVKICEVLESL